jgi:hypothetical protein
LLEIEIFRHGENLSSETAGDWRLEAGDWRLKAGGWIFGGIGKLKRLEAGDWIFGTRSCCLDFVV